MRTNAYKLLGFVVWRGAVWYLKRNYTRYLPSRRQAVLAGSTVAAVGVAAAGAVVVARRGATDVN
jgi:hypothetical protein